MKEIHVSEISVNTYLRYVLSRKIDQSLRGDAIGTCTGGLYATRPPNPSLTKRATFEKI